MSTDTPSVPLSTTQEQRDEWRKNRGQGMTSAVGEYTPSEFWDLLNDVDDLVKVLARVSETPAPERKIDHRSTESSVSPIVSVVGRVSPATTAPDEPAMAKPSTVAQPLGAGSGEGRSGDDSRERPALLSSSGSDDKPMPTPRTDAVEGTFEAMEAHSRQLERELAVAEGLLGAANNALGHQASLLSAKDRELAARVSATLPTESLTMELARALLRAVDEGKFGHLIRAGNFFSVIQQAKTMVSSDSRTISNQKEKS